MIWKLLLGRAPLHNKVGSHSQEVLEPGTSRDHLEQKQPLLKEQLEHNNPLLEHHLEHNQPLQEHHMEHNQPLLKLI